MNTTDQPRRAQDKEARAIVVHDLENSEAWADDPAPRRRRPGLSTQISLRLDTQVADKLRRIASTSGVGYAALVRRWLEERIATEAGRLPRWNVVLMEGGETRDQGSGWYYSQREDRLSA